MVTVKYVRIKPKDNYEGEVGMCRLVRTGSPPQSGGSSLVALATRLSGAHQVLFPEGIVKFLSAARLMRSPQSVTSVLNYLCARPRGLGMRLAKSLSQLRHFGVLSALASTFSESSRYVLCTDFDAKPLNEISTASRAGKRCSPWPVDLSYV